MFELKLCKGKSIRWDAVKPHQIDALLKTKNEGLYHKIADMTFGRSGFGCTLKKPFDCFFIRAQAFVVICFYIPRKKKNFYYIDIDRYLFAWNKSKKKSFTEEEAEKISTHFLK